jgi:hypothetical protein
MAAVAAIATLLISVPPALLLSRMRRLGHSSGLQTLGYRHTRAQLEWGVMVPQIAFSVMLLSIAGVLIRTLVDVERKDLGFATDRVAFVEFEIPRPGRCLIRNADAQLAYADHRRHVIEEIERLVRGSQETDAVALALFLPPDNVGSARVVARAPAGETSASIAVVRSDVGSGYFNVLGVPLLSGRDFDKTDQQGAQPVAIVSRRLAERLWPGRSPVGDLLGFLDGTSASPSSWRHVVGVVGDIEAGDGGQPPTEAVYIPAAQGLSARTVLARYLGPLADGMSALKKAVISADANVEIVRAGSLDDTMQTRRYPRRLATILLAICGGVGLLFSAIGLYGISSYAVNQRLRELALRMALGADGGTLRRSVLLRGWRIGVSGTAAGVILGVIGTRLFSRFVMPLPGLDATGLMIVSAVVMVVMTAAAAGPARRAAQVDPAEVLRQA